MKEEILIAKKKLTLCCQDGSLDTLKTLLAQYPNLINEEDNSGFTLFGIALKNGKMDMANYLNSQGANVNIVNKAY